MQKVKAKILYLDNYDKENWGAMTYAHNTDTAFDVRACCEKDEVIQAGQIKIIPAGFKLLPEYGYAYQLRGRSGNSFKLGISLANGIGTIDYGYLDEVKVILINNSEKDVVIERGMRIAQCVVEKVYQFDMKEIASEEEFGQTERGANGLGSTGVN